MVGGNVLTIEMDLQKACEHFCGSLFFVPPPIGSYAGVPNVGNGQIFRIVTWFSFTEIWCYSDSVINRVGLRGTNASS